jgi:GNAT superfamily N-acetyltransferase
MLHAYEQEPDAFTSTAEERAAEPLSWWETRIADPQGTKVALGVHHEGRLIGTVALEFSAKPKTRHKVLLIGMFVMSSSRSLGAGRALVEAAIDLARSRPGVTTMGLTVTEGNEPAIRLYNACGFQAFGTEPMAMLTSAGYKGKVHMWRAV